MIKILGIRTIHIILFKTIETSQWKGVWQSMIQSELGLVSHFHLFLNYKEGRVTASACPSLVWACIYLHSLHWKHFNCFREGMQTMTKSIFCFMYVTLSTNCINSGKDWWQTIWQTRLFRTRDLFVRFLLRVTDLLAQNYMSSQFIHPSSS